MPISHGYKPTIISTSLTPFVCKLNKFFYNLKQALMIRFTEFCFVTITNNLNLIILYLWKEPVQILLLS